MRDFTISEVLEYSRNIEKESYAFYTTVSKEPGSDKLKILAVELANEELKHYNRLNTFLEKGTLTKADMDKMIQINQEDIDHLIATKELPANSTPLSILETAYNRELKTENVYRTLLSFTNIAKDIVDTFSELALQEKGHASRLKTIMKYYQ